MQALSTTRVELLISRTHFPGAQVIDWIDQAILYQHSGENGEMFFKLRSIAIRTSCNLLIAAGYRAKHDGSQQWSWAKDMDIEDGDAKVLAPIASALVDGEEDRAGRVVAARTMLLQMCSSIICEENIRYITNYRYGSPNQWGQEE